MENCFELQPVAIEAITLIPVQASRETTIGIVNDLCIRTFLPEQ